MDESSHRVRVTASRARDHIENLRLQAGDDLVVGHRNQQYPEFVWCAAEDGHAGWVPEALLQTTADHEAVALHAYDASQLTVVKDEILEVLEQVGDWRRCRNAGGVEGWAPATILEPVPSA
jgi:SH3-like domain-containing protein